MLWLFWVAVGGSAAVAVSIWAVPKFVELLKAARSQALALAAAEKLETANAALRGDIDRLEAEAEERYAAGVAEGRAQVVGAMRANQVPVPAPMACGNNRFGLHILVPCAPESYSDGARYTLEFATTKAVLGTLEAQGFDAETGVAALVVVERTNLAFWTEIERRVEYDPSVSSDLRLRPCPLPADWPAPGAQPGPDNVPEPTQESI